MSFSGKECGAAYLATMVRDGALRLLTMRAENGGPHPERVRMFCFAAFAMAGEA
jgi:hypothetical protein